MSFADRLEKIATAIRADADERASNLEAIAIDLRRGDDVLVSIEAASIELRIKPRMLKDDLRRRGVVIEKIGNQSFVRRSMLTKKSEARSKRTTNPTPIASIDPRADERAAIARAALKIASGS